MNARINFTLAILLAGAFSITALTSPLSSGFDLLSVQLVHATNQPCLVRGSTGACSEFFLPAGPETNTLQATIFPSCNSEYTDLLSGNPTIDLPDCPAPAGVAPACTASSTLYTTDAVPGVGQFCYLQCQPPGPCTTANSWENAINDATVGLPNYFTWLNIHNPNPPKPGTIRQGFSQTTVSVNPYVATTVWDEYIVRSVYDSLYKVNPLNPSQLIAWAVVNSQQLTSVSYNGGVSGPPPGTVTTYRFILSPNILFQDGRQVTSYDAAFSYLSMVGSGAPLGASTAGCFTGVTIVGPASLT